MHFGGAQRTSIPTTTATTTEMSFCTVKLMVSQQNEIVNSHCEASRFIHSHVRNRDSCQPLNKPLTLSTLRSICPSLSLRRQQLRKKKQKKKCVNVFVACTVKNGFVCLCTNWKHKAFPNNAKWKSWKMRSSRFQFSSRQTTIKNIVLFVFKLFNEITHRLPLGACHVVRVVRQQPARIHSDRTVRIQIQTH